MKNRLSNGSLRTVRCPRTVRDLLADCPANPLQPEPKTQADRTTSSKKTSNELDELGTSQTVRGDLADGPPGANQHRKQPRGKEGKIQNSIKRPPKITKFESWLHNNTKKLFPKDLLQKINPSPPEK
jgi:hypothetical protein